MIKIKTEIYPNIHGPWYPNTVVYWFKNECGIFYQTYSYGKLSSMKGPIYNEKYKCG